MTPGNPLKSRSTVTYRIAFDVHRALEKIAAEHAVTVDEAATSIIEAALLARSAERVCERPFTAALATNTKRGAYRYTGK